MQLWIHWWSLIWKLRPACSRLQTFLWFATAVCGLSIRSDQLGVTSIIRALGLNERCYDNLLDAFHSSAISLERMTALWVQTVLSAFKDPVLVNGRLVLLGDGIKIPKRGRKMPGVKLLHQQSDSNTKPDYIMGHSFQAVTLLVNAVQGALAVHLASRIHEGVVFSNRDKRTLLDKMIILLNSLDIRRQFYFVADAYYASRKIILPLLQQSNHLISRVKSNAVAYQHLQNQNENEKRTRGRPRKYGKQVKLRSLLENHETMETALSPVYGENNVHILYRSEDLLWKPVGMMVRFVAVIHPNRGRFILMTTDLSLTPIDVIRLYGLRFKIEFSFKQAVHVIGTYAYHFWMRSMTPLKHKNGDQHYHRKSPQYRAAVRRKLHAYHLYVHAGIVAQGLMQYLAATFPNLVWNSFGSWMRTIRPGVPPSELVVADALRNTLHQFLTVPTKVSILPKFLAQKIQFRRSNVSRLAG